MTTDELLAKLDAEWDKLEAGKDGRYDTLGRHFYKYGAENWQTTDAKKYLDWDNERQQDIRKIQAIIKEERDRT